MMALSSGGLKSSKRKVDRSIFRTIYRRGPALSHSARVPFPLLNAVSSGPNTNRRIPISCSALLGRQEKKGMMRSVERLTVRRTTNWRHSLFRQEGAVCTFKFCLFSSLFFHRKNTFTCLGTNVFCSRVFLGVLPRGVWSVEFKEKTEDSWRKAAKAKFRLVDIQGVPAHRIYNATISRLKPGDFFDYRLLKNGKPVFTGQATAKNSDKQDYRFAVFGDFTASEEDATQMMLGLAAGRLNEAALTAWLRSNARVDRS
jgi:hypothetical protein